VYCEQLSAFKGDKCFSCSKNEKAYDTSIYNNDENDCMTDVAYLLCVSNVVSAALSRNLQRKQRKYDILRMNIMAYQ